MSEQEKVSAVTAEYGETRQERRERKLVARRERMHKHGAALAHVYANAVRKRTPANAERGTSKIPAEPGRSAERDGHRARSAFRGAR